MKRRPECAGRGGVGQRYADARISTVDDMAAASIHVMELAHEVWLRTPNRCCRTLTSARALTALSRAGANHRQSGGLQRSGGF